MGRLGPRYRFKRLPAGQTPAAMMEDGATLKRSATSPHIIRWLDAPMGKREIP
jgi:hypothetical protein